MRIFRFLKRKGQAYFSNNLLFNLKHKNENHYRSENQ